MYQTEHEFCLDLWRDRLDLPEVRTDTDIDELNRREYANWEEIVSHIQRGMDHILPTMRRRLQIGAYRYGTHPNRRYYDFKYDFCRFAAKRLEKYQKTGNLESLIDALNGLVLEYLFGHHPNRHFQADEKEKIRNDHL